MPNYDYKCLECGHCFQKLLPPGTETTKCLECGHPEAQKQLSAPGVVFKGSGFYKTDTSKKQNDETVSPKPKENTPKKDSSEKGAE